MRNDRLAFQSWCSRATAHIRFKADRPAVEQELMEHMEDHFNALLQEGLTLQEAERQTLCAMGDADETGAALAKVHKPYLGRCKRFEHVHSHDLYELQRTERHGGTAHRLL